MNSGEYFFQNDQYLRNPNVTKPIETYQNPREVHSTINPNVNRVTVDQTIYSFNNEILKPQGVKLYVSSTLSKLSEEIPVFNWNKV